MILLRVKGKVARISKNQKSKAVRKLPKKRLIFKCVKIITVSKKNILFAIKRKSLRVQINEIKIAFRSIIIH